MTDIAHHPLPQPDTQEVSLVGSHGVFIVGTAVDVVKQKARQAPLGQAAVVGGGDRSDVVSSRFYAGFADKYIASRLPNQGQARKLLNGGLPAGQEALKAATARPWVAFGSMWLLPSFAPKRSQATIQVIRTADNRVSCGCYSR
jgi:hypothetical protein